MFKTQALASKKINFPLKIKILHIFRLVVATIVRFIFELYYGTEKNRVPALKDDYLKLPAVEIAKKIRSKEVSSVEVVEAYIRRIKEVNPILNCVVEDCFDLALKEAKLADEEIRKGDTENLLKEKPFLGVPFTTKDSIGVKDLHLTAGVYSRKDVIAEKDADVIYLLKQKGAIVLAITNVPEICMWWDTSNTIYGRTHNPYDTTKIVGGSSGGEACLQTVSGSAFGIGSDIGGSIRIPSYFNGIFGHKPSRTIVSNNGTYPCPTLELLNCYLGVGPMTRHAVDLKPLLKIISGNKSLLLKLDEPVDLKKLKVFYQYESGAPVVDKVNKQIKNAMKKALDHLAKKTVAKSEETKIELLKKSALIWLSTMKDVTSLAELITGKDSICTTVKEILFSFIGQSNNTFIALATALTEKTGVQLNTNEYKKYLKLREELENIFTSMLGDNGVFIFPTHPTAAPYKHEPLVRPFNFSYTAAINCLGLPATQIPLGLNKEGLPIGVQVIANHNNDRLCLAVADELEKAFGGWIDPSQK